MAILKVIEVLSESGESWEHAAQSAVEEAGRSLRGMRSIYVENFQATIANGKIDKYRVNAKITFEVEN